MRIKFLLLMLALLPAAAKALPRPDHIVLVIEENHGYSQIIGSADCPYINQLAKEGALLTQSYAIGHPSEPNYLALFSGSDYGVTDDVCPPGGSPYAGDNLGSLLRAAGFSFAGYSEDLPEAGSMACQDMNKTGYRRKHNSWVDFSNLPAECNLPFSAFPTDFSKLPTVSFVVADLEHDMHDGTPKEGDVWLKKNLSAYAVWCAKNGSLLIVTWDEDNGTEENRIPTIFYGAQVSAGKYGKKTNHYGILRTLCDIYGLKAPGLAAQAKPFAQAFK